MRKTLILLSFLLIQCTTTSDSELSKAERDFAITQLNDSRDNLLNSINGLSTSQLNFNMDDSFWSIAQCLEHITIMENEIFEVLKESLELPANPERRKDLKFSDKELITHVENRTKKTKTQEDFEPTGTYEDLQALIKDFKANREKHINYLRTTKDDLRNHFTNFGSIDTYQVFLYLSGHTNRHVQQIKEIKNHPNFPNN